MRSELVIRPVQSFQDGCRVVMLGYRENESCSRGLNFVERLDDRTWCAREEKVSVIKL